MSDEILTIQELAEYLKLNEKTAYRLAGEGKLPGFKVGGSWRFKREDIEQWIVEWYKDIYDREPPLWLTGKRWYDRRQAKIDEAELL